MNLTPETLQAVAEVGSEYITYLYFKTTINVLCPVVAFGIFGFLACKIVLRGKKL